MAARLFSAYIYCTDEHSVVLAADTLDVLNIPSKIQPHLTNTLWYNIEMNTKRIYFLSAK